MTLKLLLLMWVVGTIAISSHVPAAAAKSKPAADA
jgi:hypothetical protein